MYDVPIFYIASASIERPAHSTNAEINTYLSTHLQNATSYTLSTAECLCSGWFAAPVKMDNGTVRNAIHHTFSAFMGSPAK
mmetsp:Transcript_34793/g.64004  ORF Transcript_34793/g.64004 Transcript_34793/m.64004 type:complete len:81 (-) Transcript_34793:105-347(-)